MPARTASGVIAKAKIALAHVSGVEAIEKRLAERLHLFGPDVDSAMLAIPRDLTMIAEAGGLTGLKDRLK